MRKTRENIEKIESYIESNIENVVPIESAKGGNYFEAPTTVKDTNGNFIKVPQGFKIAQDSGLNVTQGIVIEENDIKIWHQIIMNGLQNIVLMLLVAMHTLVLAEVEVMITTIIAQSIETVALLYVVIA